MEVAIGDQIWMVENLNVDRFRNGDPIPNAVKVKEWKDAWENKQPAWCHYKLDPANGAAYGKLYNCYAVMDPRGLAPEGWHIPSIEEWDRLIAAIGGIDTFEAGKWAYDILRSRDGWEYYSGLNTEQTNSIGFSGMPAGERGLNGLFDGIGDGTYWWSTTEEVHPMRNEYEVWTMQLGYGSVNRNPREKGKGFSVRCLKD